MFQLRLYLLKLLSDVTFHRKLHMPFNDVPRKVLFTDATGDGMVGFVLYDSSARPSSWSCSQLRLPNNALLARVNQVTSYELLAPLWALQNLPQLHSCALDVYVDNVAAEHILRKGSSTASDLNDLVASFWTLVMDKNLTLRVFRVPSKLNTADEASRFLRQGKVPPLGGQPTESSSLFLQTAPLIRAPQ